MNELTPDQAIITALLENGRQTQNKLWRIVAGSGICSHNTFVKYLKSLIRLGNVKEEKIGKQLIEYSLVDSTKKDETFTRLQVFEKIPHISLAKTLQKVLKTYKQKKNHNQFTLNEQSHTFAVCTQEIVDWIEIMKYRPILSSHILSSPNTIKLTKKLNKQWQDELDEALLEIKKTDIDLFNIVISSVYNTLVNKPAIKSR